LPYNNYVERMMGKIIRIVLAISFLATALAVAGCSSEANPAPPNVTVGSAPGNMAPDFQLKDLDGRDLTLMELRGRPVLLNFWATWCGPCKAEMPLIQAIYEDEAWSERDLVILAIDIGEPVETVEKFIQENGLSFPILLDDTMEVAKAYNIRAIPTTFLINENGIIANITVGAFQSNKDLKDTLRKHFK